MIIVRALGITISGFIIICQSQNLQRIYSRLSSFGCSDRPSEGVDHIRDPLRLAGCDDTAGERGGDRGIITAAISAAFSIGGNVNLTGRSRHGGTMRSMQSRNAVGSPASASSTALRVKAS